MSAQLLISPIEEHVIRKLRAVLDNRYGELKVKVDQGRVVEVVPTFPSDRQALEAYQREEGK